MATDRPSISVVVPVYDVSDYLGACLDSVLAQDVAGLEVLCIDDGSTDDSGDIADAYAARDPRITVVHQDNAGLGATRNRGAELARGEYLAFLDSDDLVPPGAYARLLASLRETGSDVATGDIRRLTSVGLRPSPTFSPIYTPARRATDVRRDPALLRDRIAPNKLFRTDFWRENGFSFTTGVLYEDIPAVLPALVLARSIDVLDDVVYIWRIRTGADRSITQRRLEPRALDDRVAAVTSVSRFLADRGETELKRAYDTLALTDDLRLFAREADRGDDTYVADLLRLAGTFLAQADPHALDDAPAVERARWYLIAAGDGAGVVELARMRRIDPAGPPARRRGGNVEAVLPIPDAEQRVPASLLALGPELELRTAVLATRVDGTRLHVDGWAAIAHADVPTPRAQRLRFWLEHTGTGERLPLKHTATTCDEASAQGRPDRHDLRGAGFTVTIDAAPLADRWARGTDRWRLHVEVDSDGLVRSGPVSGARPGAARRPPTVDVGKLRVGPRLDQDVVDVVVAARPVLVTALRATADAITLELTSRRRLTHLRLRAVGRDDVLVPVEHADGAVVATLRRDHLGVGETPSERSCTLHALDDQGRAARLSVDDHVDQVVLALDGGAAVLDVSRYGYAAVRIGPPVLWLAAADAAGDGGLVLTGRLVGGVAAALAVVALPRDRHDPRPVAVEHGDGDAVALRLDPHVVARSPGTAELEARIDGTPIGCSLARTLVTRLPVALPGAPLPATFDDRSWQRPAIEVGDLLAADERGYADQQRLWAQGVATATRFRRRRLDGGVVVVARGGRSTGGCPRAVADELRRRDPSLAITWAVRDAACVPPDGAAGVVVGSAAWHDALARAHAIVTDSPLPAPFERADQQRVVRLWDGVPVRPVGRLAPGVRGAEQPADAARAWSHLVAAGPAAAATLGRAFDLASPPLPVGLPRHDVVDDPGQAAARRTRARTALGLRDDEPAVLHLPTWADAARHPGGGLRRIDDLDLPALHAALARAVRAAHGDDAPAPRLLIRSHPAVVDTYAELDAVPCVDDVRGDVDVVDLLLAADVVVAHPSSVVLEAVRVGRPVVLHDPAGYGLATQLGPPSVDLVVVARPDAVTTGLDDLVLALAELIPTATAATADPSRHLEVVGGSAAAAVADVLGA